MLSGVQPGNGMPHDRYNRRGIAHVRTKEKRRYFHAKTTRQNLYMYIGVGQKEPYPARAYTTLVVLVVIPSIMCLSATSQSHHLSATPHDKTKTKKSSGTIHKTPQPQIHETSKQYLS